MENKVTRRELDIKVLEKVGQVISDVHSANHVDQVIYALHSLAIHLFPLDSSLLSDCIDPCYRDQILNAKVPSEKERRGWWHAFYDGAAFTTFSRVLLLDIATKWLACFSFTVRKHVYDVFLNNGCASVVVQTLVPYLTHCVSGAEGTAIRSNCERLLVHFLFENNGVLQLTREFTVSCHSKGYTDSSFNTVVSRVAQIVSSIPDRAQLKATTSLSSHFFFKQLSMHLLSLAEGGDINVVDSGEPDKARDIDGSLIFIGEMFSRISRRGFTDVLAHEIILRVMKHVQNVLSFNKESFDAFIFESNPGSQFWLKMVETVKDHYAVERMAEQLLHQLTTKCETDTEAYWILWLLFHRISAHQISVRTIFVDKFLLWKVFPVKCLRWLLQFSVLECPPDANSLKKGSSNRLLLDTVQRLVVVWSSKDFVQSTSMEQQAYISAAIGLCLEVMTKEELDQTQSVMQSILQGVSNRLESPNHWIRKMASNVALVFSKVIDPKNLLYLDETSIGEIIDWELGGSIPVEGRMTTKNGSEEKEISCSSSLPEVNYTGKGVRGKKEKSKPKKISEINLLHPDEIIDPATLDTESSYDKEDDGNLSENSDLTNESSSSSLQPYDLSDNDSDLTRKFSHLVDVVGALRKSDDADGVQEALEIAEKLIRASPDELKHIARDLTRTLVQVRCSNLAVEGEEDSAEDKRQRALVALLVMTPIESLDTLNKLLYSPNVDISQRILILDVMTDAAQELANTTTMKIKSPTKPLISTVSEAQPWFLPGNKGPLGAGSWKEISVSGTLLSWSNSYERELPLKHGSKRRGKTRRWSVRASNVQDNQIDWSHNKFPLYAAAFMLPAMEGFDKKRHGVDLLNRDFIVLGKLIYMLGVCMKCAALHPEASAIAPALFDMLRTREVCHHKEAYVRRAVLFAASCILTSLHSSFVASSLVEGNHAIAEGMEWVRALAINAAESDTDRECYTMAMACLQLHSEMALQASRALESADLTPIQRGVALPPKLSIETIKIPLPGLKY